MTTSPSFFCIYLSPSFFVSTYSIQVYTKSLIGSNASNPYPLVSVCSHLVNNWDQDFHIINSAQSVGQRPDTPQAISLNQSEGEEHLLFLFISVCICVDVYSNVQENVCAR